MSYLEQAEKLVRNHPANKELMELGFGCELEAEHNVMHPFSGLNKHTDTFVVASYNPIAWKMAHFVKKYEGDCEIRFSIVGYEDDKIKNNSGIKVKKILGKPPHLEHYLRVLGEQSGVTASLVVCGEQKNGDDAYGIEVEYETKEMETKYLFLSCTTGKPATEEDAEEFIKLVS